MISRHRLVRSNRWAVKIHLLDFHAVVLFPCVFRCVPFRVVVLRPCVAVPFGVLPCVPIGVVVFRP